MQEMKDEKFLWNNEIYDIKLMKNDNGYIVRGFKDETPSTEGVFVSNETIEDFYKTNKESIFNEIFEEIREQIRIQ